MSEVVTTYKAEDYEFAVGILEELADDGCTSQRVRVLARYDEEPGYVPEMLYALPEGLVGLTMEVVHDADHPCPACGVPIPQYEVTGACFTTGRMEPEQRGYVIQLAHTAVVASGSGRHEFEVTGMEMVAQVSAYLREQEITHEYTVTKRWTGPHDED